MDLWQYLSKSDKKIVMYGMGNGADKILAVCEKYGVPFFVQGDPYTFKLKGYEQYDKFLSKIIDDSTAFINVRQLEIFLKRNIPELYSYKTDSTYVSDEEFLSVYGVSEKQAIEHYTNKFAKNMNERRKARKDKMYEVMAAVKEIDNKSFFTVSTVMGVYGEGFEEVKTGFKVNKKNKSEEIE